MRNVRPLLAAAALGVIALGTTGANASAVPPPPLPKSGESAVDYTCNTLLPFYGVSANCDDIECGPRSCDSIQGDRVR